MGRFLRDFGAFLLERKRFWLLPVVVVLALLAAVVFLTGGPALSPLIYSAR